MTVDKKELDIPTEKAEVIARAREYQAGGWEALKDMSFPQLQAFEEEVDGAYVWEPASHGRAAYNDVPHPHNQVRLDALSAIIAERKRREDERIRHDRDQHDRANLITEVCGQLAEISKKLDRIATIEPDPRYAFVGVQGAPVLDVASASDGELASALRECRFIIDRYDPGVPAQQAEAIGIVKGKTAAAIASGLSARAEAIEKARGDAASLIAEVQEEQARREHQRAVEAAKLAPEAMAGRIAELEKRLAASEEGTV
jgi:hypothetical protein